LFLVDYVFSLAADMSNQVFEFLADLGCRLASMRNYIIAKITGLASANESHWNFVTLSRL
jgi:hypothetical protein